MCLFYSIFFILFHFIFCIIYVNVVVVVVVVAVVVVAVVVVVADVVVFGIDFCLVDFEFDVTTDRWTFSQWGTFVVKYLFLLSRSHEPGVRK